ncbi:DUF4157 domain-containing protein [Alphaproteobacteria bacterium HT1-32]|nr:DUF4157 domain-containing protein [Alphaproteobacteria bacterium HT1-32]
MTYRDTAFDDEELRHRLEPHWFEGSFSAMGDGGDPLPDELLSFYAKRYDCDLSDVRLHTDNNAQAICSMLGTRAFVAGDRIFFAAASAAQDQTLLVAKLTKIVRRHLSAKQAAVA